MAVINEPFTYRKVKKSPYTDSRFPGTYQYASSDSQVLVGDGYVNRVSDPKWRDKIASKASASNPYAKRVYRLRPGRISWSGMRYDKELNATFNARNDMVWGGYSGSFPCQPTTDSSLRDVALSRLKRKLSSELNDFKAIAPIAELRELRHSIRTTASLGYDLVLALLELRKTKGRSAAKYAAEHWLNFSFAVTPTIATANDLIAAIESYLDAQSKVLRLSGGATKRWREGYVDTSLLGSMNGGFGNNIRYSWTIEHELGYRFIAGIKLDLATANAYTVDRKFGLQFGDIVPALWELTPYSWLFDYFTTMGAFLEDVFSDDGTTTFYVVENRRQLSKFESSFWNVPWTGWKEISNSGGSRASGYLFDFERGALTNLPRRQLRFKTVDEIGINAVTKLLNLSSLLVSRKL
jgi:hypothetical protein